MTLYPFEMQLAVDALHPDTVVQNGAVTIYDPSDTAMATPLTLLDTAGLPMANPLPTSAAGFVLAFQADIPQIMWSDGTWAGYLSSYKGLLDEAIAAKEAAQAAIINGMPTGGITTQVLVKDADLDYVVSWRTLIVIIGPADAWPTGLADGTLVVRTET